MSEVKGWARDRYGIRAYVKVGTGKNAIQREKRFPFTAKPKTIENWREETRVALRHGLPTPAPTDALRSEIDRYLVLVKAMPTYQQRKDHLELWEAALGADTQRSEITSDQIRAVLQAWRQSGLSAATCNKRRTALMHLWSTLDGKDARNPVRAVPKFRVDDPLPRGRDPHVIDAKLLLAPRCRSRACCRVMLWTGLRPYELNRAEPDDLDLAHHTLIARTGKGGRTRVIPLTSQAVSAWKEFLAAKCWHDVPEAAPLGRWLKKITGIDSLRVYDLRHSYGTALARRQTRLDVIGSLMGHSTLELTRRYTLAAVTPDALEATAKLARRGKIKTRKHEAPKVLAARNKN